MVSSERGRSGDPLKEVERAIEVTSSGNRQIIIPALRGLLAVNSDSTTPRDKKSETVISQARETLLLPVWGDSLTDFSFPVKLVHSDYGFTSYEPTDTDGYTAGVTNATLRGRAICGRVPTLRSPRVSDSLIIAEGSMPGGGKSSNPPEFSSDHMEGLAHLITGVRENNMDGVMDSLQQIGPLLSNYETSLYGDLNPDETEQYARFGHLASTAKIVDRYNFPELQKGTSDVVLDNSVVFGRHILSNTLGGEITDSILFASGGIFDLSHVAITNSYVITPAQELYIEKGICGNPEAAKIATQGASELSQYPLAEFARVA